MLSLLYLMQLRVIHLNQALIRLIAVLRVINEKFKQVFDKVLPMKQY